MSVNIPKLAHNFRIIRPDGTVYDMAQIGVLVNRFTVDAPEPTFYNETIVGRPGFIDMGTDYVGRTISAECMLLADGLEDFVRARREVFRVFESSQAFYLSADEDSAQRWLVKCTNKFSLARIGSTGSFTLDFASASPYSETIGTTLETKYWADNAWRWSDEISWSGEINYTHSTTSFTISNKGDVLVNPRYMPLVITYTGASTNLSIKNVTTGDEWALSGTTSASDITRLDGVRSTKNSLSIYRNTNRKLITMVPGDNQFQLTGTSGSFTISFEFRHHYL